jgi:catalase
MNKMKTLTMANGRQVEDIANAILGVHENIVRLQLSYFTAADQSYGEGIAKHLNIKL